MYKITKGALTFMVVLWTTCVVAACVASQAGQSTKEPCLEGLIGARFGAINFQRVKEVHPLDSLDLDWTKVEGDDDRGSESSAKWEGFIVAPISGDVTFHVACDYLVTVTINGQRIIASEGIEKTHRLELEKGRKYPIMIRYVHKGRRSFLSIAWSWKGQPKTAIPVTSLQHSVRQQQKWKDYINKYAGKDTQRSVGRPPTPLTDWSNWPHGLSVLMNEKIIFPLDTSIWKIKIDTSRQLFVDNHLISRMDNIERQFHAAKKHPANPIPNMDYTHGGYIWPDPQGGYRLYYNIYRLLENGKTAQAIRLALSDDGVHWKLPDLDICEFDEELQQGTNRVFTQDHVGKHNNVLIPRALLNGLFYEPSDPNPDEKWKAIVRDYSIGQVRLDSPFIRARDLRYNGTRLESPIIDDEEQTSVKIFAINKLYTSPDGLHWTFKEEIYPQLEFGRFVLDLATDNFPMAVGAVFRTRWDPYLQKYIAHTKHVIGPDWRFDPIHKGRAVGWMESDDLIHWSSPRIYIYPDSEDDKIPGMYGTYEADGFRYESMWLGCLSTISYIAEREGLMPEKSHWIRLAGSRDGRHWYYLGNREPLISAGQPGEWDTHYMRMLNLATTGGPVERDDELWFYYWGRSKGESYPEHRLHLGVATLRKDGFASLNAKDSPGMVVTRPLVFEGKGRLFVNAESSPEGYVKASVLDEYGDEIDGFGSDICKGVHTDTVRGELSWTSGETLASLKDRHIRLALHLKNAKLYSFWIE